jgi:hypothetical protein
MSRTLLAIDVSFFLALLEMEPETLLGRVVVSCAGTFGVCGTSLGLDGVLGRLGVEGLSGTSSLRGT